MIQFSCLTYIPNMTKGLVRELRVRWMLEELGLPHEEQQKRMPQGMASWRKCRDYGMPTNSWK